MQARKRIIASPPVVCWPGRGALSALIYAPHCTESAAAFLAVWFVLEIVIPSLAGAVLGPRALRW